MRSSASWSWVAFVVTQDVHRSLERRCGGHLGVEVAQQGALDVDDAAVARERLFPHQEQDIAPRPCERRADERPDAAGAQHGVSHHGGKLPRP